MKKYGQNSFFKRKQHICWKTNGSHSKMTEAKTTEYLLSQLLTYTKYLPVTKLFTTKYTRNSLETKGSVLKIKKGALHHNISGKRSKIDLKKRKLS